MSNSKRLAKNTILLYVRMIIVMSVTLFTSRIILDLLGAEDYGINNIINGVIILFSFVNTALLTASQRFLNYYVGIGDNKKVNTIFCMSMNTFLILSVTVLILGETIGLWFVNSQLNIPSNRMSAAQWVYQFTLVQFIFNLLRIPYNASIISYERMDFYAYVSLFEVSAKLAICYVLYVIPFDRLITISCLNSLVPIFMLIIYYIYCNKVFKTTKFKFFWDTKLFKEIFSFSGWSLFGSLANLTAQQGINILLNIFYGVTVNAAAGISNQVTHAVNNLVSNFQMAYNPQITKAYAMNDKERFEKLIIQTSKFAFFLMSVIVFPFMICINRVLDIWLIDVPEYTNIFCQLILVFLLMDAFMMPMVFAVQATGKIKHYQIIMAGIIFVNFPIAYLFLKFGMPPYCVWYIRILINCFVFIARIVYMKANMNFVVYTYIKEALFPVLIVTFISFPIPLLLHNFMDNSLIYDVCIGILSFMITTLAIYYLGMSSLEREIILSVVYKKAIKIKRFL